MQHEATLPMEPAHRPRPFGFGLRACTELAEVVTVGSVRTRTVGDPSRAFSFSTVPVATDMDDSEQSMTLELQPRPVGPPWDRHSRAPYCR